MIGRRLGKIALTVLVELKWVSEAPRRHIQNDDFVRYYGVENRHFVCVYEMRHLPVKYVT